MTRIHLGLIWASATLFAWAVLLAGANEAWSQGGQFRQPVGGISIDAAGTISTASIDESRLLRDAILAASPGIERQADDLKRPTTLRKVSLRALQAALQEHLSRKEPIPDEVRYLAGLQTIQHVFVYPDRNDIVLAGFGEGWKVDDRGFVVGITTGRPVLLLDDLTVALRSVLNADSLTCSIDPTADGLLRLQEYVNSLASAGRDIRLLQSTIEQRLGLQKISIDGIDPSSHLARVMIAADVKMKRIAMALDRSPVAALPSYMSMISGGGRGVNNLLPRWWLTSDYAPLLHTEDKTAWEIKGQGVKAVSVEDRLSADGSIERSVRQGGATQRWADQMTSKYAELAVKEPIFGQLRGVMDLTIVAALISHEHLAERAALDLSVLLEQAPVEQYPIALQTPSIAQAILKGTSLVISASGGVELKPLAIVREQQTSDKLNVVRDAAATAANRWWWN